MTGSDPRNATAASSAPPHGPSRQRRLARELRRPLGWLRQSEAAPLGGSFVASLAFGIILGVAAAAIRAAFDAATGIDLGFLPYFAAVLLAAWAGGLTAGLLATLASALADALGFEPPLGVLAIETPAGQVRIAVFLALGILASFIASSLRRATAAALEARAAAIHSADETELLLRREVRTHAAAEHDRLAFERLQTVTASLGGASTPFEVADAILGRGLEALEASAGAITRLDADAHALELVAARGYPAEVVHRNTRYALDRPSQLSDAIRLRRPVFLPDAATWRQRYPGSGPRSLDENVDVVEAAYAALPLIATDQVIGMLALRWEARQDFAGGLGALVERLAGQCALALDRAFREDEQRREHDTLARSEARAELLAEASHILASILDVSTTLPAVASLAIEAVARGCLIELAGQGDDPIVALAHGDPVRMSQLRELGALVPGAAGRALALETAGQHGAVLEALPTWDEERLPPRAAELAHTIGAASMVMAPIGGPEAPLGTVTFLDDRPNRFGTEDLALAKDLAARIAVVVANARLFTDVSRFKSAVDAGLDGVAMFDPHTLAIGYANEAMASQMGYATETLLGMRADTVMPELNAESLPAALQPLLLGELASRRYTTRLRRSGEPDLPVEIALQPVRMPGGSVTIILTSRDVSDRITAQAQLARIARDERARAAELDAVLEGMGDGVVVFDDKGQVRLANDAARDLVGADLSRYGDVPEQLGITAAQLPALGESSSPVTLEGRDRRWFELTAYATALGGDLFDEGHRPSTILLVRDVSRTREVAQAREAFIGVLSHELRTPVTTIYGNAKVLRRPRGKGQAAVSAELLDDIEAESDRLYRIVEDLLALSRVEGGLEVEGEPLLLQHVVSDVVHVERPRWPELHFTLRMPNGLPAAFGERTYVEQVTRNLISNAGKYSPAGTEVEVIVESSASEVLVRVLDRGVGIKPDEAERLFQLYYRSPDTARSAAGAGIGLFVCRGLVEAMGGRIWAVAREGGGSEFGFSLPRTADGDA